MCVCYIQLTLHTSPAYVIPSSAGILGSNVKSFSFFGFNQVHEIK